MSTTSARADAIAAVELFCELWSKFFFAYQGRRRPLKIGIHRDIPATLIDPATVSLALKFYTGTSGCLASMKPGATRIDLEGNEIGSVSDGDAAGAKEILAARRKREAEKKAARRQQKQAVKKTPPAAPAPSHAPAPSPAPARRDSLSSLREAARKRGGVV